MLSDMLTVSRRMPNTKARRLRREGYVPGVLYGGDAVTMPVLFDKKKVEYFVTHMDGNALFEVVLDGEIRPVRIREIQRDPVTREIIHIDLQNVFMDQRIEMDVPLKFEGIQELERRGLIVQHQKNTARVEGLAKDMPAHIKVPLHLLKDRPNIKVADLEVAQELSILDPPEALIALMVKPSREVEETPAQEPLETEGVPEIEDPEHRDNPNTEAEG